MLQLILKISGPTRRPPQLPDLLAQFRCAGNRFPMLHRLQLISPLIQKPPMLYPVFAPVPRCYRSSSSAPLPFDDIPLDTGPLVSWPLSSFPSKVFPSRVPHFRGSVHYCKRLEMLNCASLFVDVVDCTYRSAVDTPRSAGKKVPFQLHFTS